MAANFKAFFCELVIWAQALAISFFDNGMVSGFKLILSNCLVNLIGIIYSSSNDFSLVSGSILFRKRS